MQPLHNKPHFGATHPDVATLAAWREQLTLTTHSPQLKQQLLSQERNYLPRFSRQYNTLRALPRRLRRSLQRQWKQSLAGMALLLTLGQAPALAATLTVSGPVQTQNVIALCSLVDAITAANADTATGGCPAGSGADTIVLPVGSTQTLTAVNNSTYFATGLPVITSTITIQGNNSTITRVDGAPDFRIFAVNGSGNLTLQRTTVSGGEAPFVIGEFYAPGGGIANYRGIVTLTNSTVSGNSAYLGGGGVYNFLGTMALTNSTVSGNYAFRFSGGVFNRGIVTLTNSTVSGNSAGDSGGVYNLLGTMTLTNSTVSGNSARFGSGGVTNRDGTMTLTNSTVSGNSAHFAAGGVTNRGDGTMTLTNSTVSDNVADFSGGGVQNDGTLTLSRSLISGNTASRGAPEVDNDGPYADPGIVNADNFNLFGYSGNAGVMGFIPGPSDIVPGVPLGSILSPLADNGGPTLTHALVSGSPAVDEAGRTCSATDQRGISRPQGPACDIGAFELISTRPTVCNGAAITIFGTAGNDVITGTPGRDVIHALTGNDLINSLAGNDVLCGGVGNDRLFGGTGFDLLAGDSGADQLFGGDQNDILLGGLGNDQLIGGLGNDGLSGNEGNDTVLGNEGDDRLFGQSGDDRLFGGAGNDALNGGLNTDRCDGQTGAGDSAVACETTLNVP